MITREEFINAYCERSQVTWTWLSQFREALPCDCGEDECEGWQMAPILPTKHRGGLLVWGSSVDEGAISVDPPNEAKV